MLAVALMPAPSSAAHPPHVLTLCHRGLHVPLLPRCCRHASTRRPPAQSPPPPCSDHYTVSPDDCAVLGRLGKSLTSLTLRSWLPRPFSVDLKEALAKVGGQPLCVRVCVHVTCVYVRVSKCVCACVCVCVCTPPCVCMTRRRA